MIREKNIVETIRGSSPVVLGMPHTGTYVPSDIFVRLNANGKKLADTDWHIHRLYDGLIENVTSVRALFHRYVIDPNRDPSGQSLYPGQNTTGLCPIIDFDNNDLYETGQDPKSDEIEERRVSFHQAYHDSLAQELERIKAIHGFAILYDCHSIRSQIPHLFEGKLPDFNIGTFQGKSCNTSIGDAVEQECKAALPYTYVVNGRFKGGWTTRHYGDPANDIHAIQMELSQSAYMDEKEPWDYLPDTAKGIRPYLAKILKNLTEMRL